MKVNVESCDHNVLRYDGLQEILEDATGGSLFIPQFTCRAPQGLSVDYCCGTFLYDQRSSDNTIDINGRTFIHDETGWYIKK